MGAERTMGRERPRTARSWAELHPQAALLDGALPGPDLVRALDSLTVPDQDDTALVEVMAGWGRIISWAVARQADVVAEMARRAPGSRVDFIADDIASRLGVSRRAGEGVVALAAGLATFPRVHDALGRGDLDPRKAAALLAETDHLPESIAATLHDAVLPGAPTMTVPQLRAQVRKVETTLDPAAAAGRHERARADRCVRLVHAPDAMAWIHALLPAPDAMTVVTALDALAAASDPRDPRGVDARRADALTDLCRHHLDSGLDLSGTPLPNRQHRRPHLQLTVSAPVGVGVGVGVGELRGTAELAGYGPVPISAVQHLLAEADWRPVLTDPATGEVIARGARTYRPSAAVAAWIVDRDVTCTFPGCRVPAARCDLDHIEPFDHDDPGSGGPTTADNLQALCRHHHRLKTTGSWSPRRDGSTGSTLWTSPTGHSYVRAPVSTDPGWIPPPRPPDRRPSC